MSQVTPPSIPETAFMDLQNSFVVPADIDTAWKTLQDVEGLAPCMPGATLTSHDGDDMTGNVKVKLGPVAMTFAGQARFVSRDEATHTMVIEGSGKETKGTGTAKGTVTAVLVEEAPDRTRVDITTEFSITGKAAQFGRGVMQDVAGRIIDQFSENLAATMTAGAAGGAAAAESDAPSEGAAPTAAAASAPAAALPHHEDSIDLLGTAGAPVLQRAIPAAIAAVVVIGVIVWLARRRRD
ncbi:MAG: SRPBCC family protein [Candidatus Nanopelagicales bacterium]